MEHKLQQVFLNLFLNAKDAMPKGGWLSVATRVERRRVMAEVADTGSGIPSEYLARIYDPFFTTKAIGQGTGLGLSITYGIVREHDGTIECDSTVGQGTRFMLSFPAASAQAAAGVRRDAAADGHDCRHMRRNGSILVIDDEEIMREILEALLTREGYERAPGRDRRRGRRAGAVDVVRRRHRRRDDAGHGRHRDARRAEEARRRAAGGDDHGVRVGRDRDRGDEARRLRLHHQAVQERRGAGRGAQRASSGAS